VTPVEPLVALIHATTASMPAAHDPGTDLVVLGQFSISTEHPAVQDAVPVPVLSPAHLAVDLVRDRLGERTPA
jgi:hypothetical protein